MVVHPKITLNKIQNHKNKLIDFQCRNDKNVLPVGSLGDGNGGWEGWRTL